MSSRLAIVVSTFATLAAIAALALVARASFEADGWVKVDQAFGIVPALGAPFSADDPLDLDITVPSTGLARIDLRFDVSRKTPSAKIEGDLQFELRGDEGRLLWQHLVPLETITPERAIELTFPEVSERHEHIRLRVIPLKVGSSTRIAAFEMPCDCIAMAKMYRGGGRQASDSDADMTVYSWVDGRAERLAVALDRIDQVNPGGFGRAALLIWSSVTLAAGSVLFWITLFFLLRRDMRQFRSQADEVASLRRW